jgi:hypothetical protein
MVARCVAIEGGGKWNACLLGYKTIAAFWFAMIVFLKTTSLSFIWLALLFSSETIFEMCSNNVNLLSTHIANCDVINLQSNLWFVALLTSSDSSKSKACQQSVHLTGGMASANALALGDVRRRLTRPICTIFKHYLRPSRILLTKFCPRPPTRK